MYFIIQPIQRDKYTDMGMINISANLYLEEGDIGYDKYMAEHHIQVPVIPEGGYPGEMKEGSPVNKEDYQKRFDGLEKVWKLNPFCNHSIQFDVAMLEPDYDEFTVEERIMYCFEWALGITHWNYLMDDLHCKKKDKDGKSYSQIVNKPFHYSARRTFYQGISLIPEKDRSDYMKQEMKKVDKASARLSKIKDVDFTKVKTIGKYKVK